MIQEVFKQEREVNITYHKIYILNIYANSLNSRVRILCTQKKSNILSIKYIHDNKLQVFFSKVEVATYQEFRSS